MRIASWVIVVVAFTGCSGAGDTTVQTKRVAPQPKSEAKAALEVRQILPGTPFSIELPASFHVDHDGGEFVDEEHGIVMHFWSDLYVPYGDYIDTLQVGDTDDEGWQLVDKEEAQHPEHRAVIVNSKNVNASLEALMVVIPEEPGYVAARAIYAPANVGIAAQQELKRQLLSARTRLSTWDENSPAEIPLVTPGLELQSGDYAVARKSFDTKLIRRGPAPQETPPLETPAGARELKYASGGLSLTAFVDPPPGDGKRKPAVIFLHGGFGFEPGDWTNPQAFREAGYVVMTPVLRGESHQPGSYSMFIGEVDDILAATDSLIELPYVDPNQLFVAGYSVGGTLAILSALSTDRFRAAASISGATDPIAWSLTQPEVIPFDYRDTLEYRMRAPMAYATSFKCPTRLFFGTEEKWTYAGSYRTAMLAQKSGLDVAIRQVPGDHGTCFPVAVSLAVEFFNNEMRKSPSDLP